MDEGALIWQFMYNGFPFRVDEEISLDMIDRKAEEIFSRKIKLDVIRKTYTDEFMSSTGLIDYVDTVVFNSKLHENQYNAIYGYFLLNSWEKYLPNETEITIGCLSENLAWSNRLGFDDEEIMNVLDDLSDEGYIKVNKQLHPCTIIKTEISNN